MIARRLAHRILPLRSRVCTHTQQATMATASAAAVAGEPDVVLTMPLIDDLHIHLRDGPAMCELLKQLPPTVARAIVMPNLRPPVTSTEAALAYRRRILDAYAAAHPDAHAPGSVHGFTPLMTLYLTDMTTPEEISKAHATGHIHAVKFYPAGATTNSDHGVTDMVRTYPALERMATHGMPLLIHGEVTDTSVDVFDRERVFVAKVLPEIVARVPGLKIVLEHITTRDAAEFVLRAGPNVAATITAHHLLYNRNALFEGGIRPHRYCLPILKPEDDRQALLDVIRSGHKRFFLGTDSAPHARTSKECPCGAAGMYTAHAAVELYALAFESVGALPHLPAFVSENGADFYGLPRNRERPEAAASQVVLTRDPWTVPDSYSFGPDAEVVPAKAGETLPWKAHVVPKR